MAKRRKECFEAKATLECTICDKDIEVGDRYCLNDRGEPMHYYCYDVSTPLKAGETEKQTDSEESEGGNNGEKELCSKRIGH
jgi:hypothetical protein